MAQFAGVDGCRAGWVMARLAEPDLFAPLAVAPTFADVAAATAEATLVLVDVPMGLGGPGPQPSLRQCDQAARKLLAKQWISIFPVPVRAAVYAGSHEEASLLNHAATGKRISLQSWNICPKIAEADQVMRREPALQARLRESHPELCFTLLGGGHPVPHSKRTAEGREERLAILAQHARNAAAVFEEASRCIPRSVAAPDDLLDAMVLAVTARLAHAAGVPTVPAEPPVDEFGLRMEIVCPPGDYSL